jgi:hypothetical protein
MFPLVGVSSEIELPRMQENRVISAPKRRIAIKVPGFLSLLPDL